VRSKNANAGTGITLFSPRVLIGVAARASIVTASAHETLPAYTAQAASLIAGARSSVAAPQSAGCQELSAAKFRRHCYFAEDDTAARVARSQRACLCGARCSSTGHRLAAIAMNPQPVPHRLLDFFHRLIAGGLVLASATGTAVVAYGMYRLGVVRPRERMEAAAAAGVPRAGPDSAAGGATAAAPVTPAKPQLK
jgi:hypothetical protein